MSVAVTVAVTVAGRERQGATRRHMAHGHGEHTDLDMWWRGDDNSHVKKPAVKWGFLVEPRSVRGPGPGNLGPQISKFPVPPAPADMA